MICTAWTLRDQCAVAQAEGMGSQPHRGALGEKTGPALSRIVPWWDQDPFGGASAGQAPENSLTKRP
jgi:hypothetical protein